MKANAKPVACRYGRVVGDRVLLHLILRRRTCHVLWGREVVDMKLTKREVLSIIILPRNCTYSRQGGSKKNINLHTRH